MAILPAAQALSLVNVLALLSMSATGTLTTAALFVATGVSGIINIFDQPARQVLVSELVPQASLANAIGLSSTIYQTGMMVGPAVGGLLLPLGGSWGFAAAAALEGLSLAALAAIRASLLIPRALAPRGSGQIVESLRYIRRRKPIFWTLLILVFVSSLGLHWSVLLSAMAMRTFESGAVGYGLYSATYGAGALVGALIAIRRTRIRMRSVYAAVAAAMALEFAAAIAPWEPLFMLLVAGASACIILMWTAANSLLQFTSGPEVRGRVMALYLLIALGTQAIGSPALGWVTQQIGPRAGMAIGSIVPLAAALAIGAVLARRSRGDGDLLW